MAIYEPCPLCGSMSATRPKLVLMDAAWEPAPGKDYREFFFADVRVGDITPGALREQRLEQFIDAFYCERCAKAFVSENVLQGRRWQIRARNAAILHYKARAEALRAKPSQLVADLSLYVTGEGGKKIEVEPGWGCPCCCSKSPPFDCWDGWPQLDTPLSPGDSRRVGFVFLSGDTAAERLQDAGIFYLWEGRIIGEARVVTPVREL